ncbi:MAG: FtsQ-type POTRA domain-containing protein [Lachnospiraceae bacterium]|nr:FtsQ-type POTRA domain-containing protein [Lachnospiraceae bacterium]
MGKSKKKKKKSQSKFKFYFINILLGIVIVVVALMIMSSILCVIHDVEVSGAKHYSEIEIEEYVLTGKYKGNSIYVFADNLVHPKKDIPFVESAKVKLNSYDKVKIEIKEKSMLGYMAMTDGNFAYFDEEGNVVEVSNIPLSDVMFFAGIQIEKAVEGEPLGIDEKQLSRMLAVMRGLEKYNIPVNAANFDENGNFVVAYNSVYINFGKGDNAEEKVKRLQYILPNLVDMSGILHLEDWTTQDTDIVFEKTT